jgi:hypothetical protein
MVDLDCVPEKIDPDEPYEEKINKIVRGIRKGDYDKFFDYRALVG